MGGAGWCFELQRPGECFAALKRLRAFAGLLRSPQEGQPPIYPPGSVSLTSKVSTFHSTFSTCCLLFVAVDPVRGTGDGILPTGSVQLCDLSYGCSVCLCYALLPAAFPDQVILLIITPFLTCTRFLRSCSNQGSVSFSRTGLPTVYYP